MNDVWAERAQEHGRGAVDLRAGPADFDAHTMQEWRGLFGGLAPHLPSNFNQASRRILDFGCGAGRFAALLSNGGRHFVTAFDPCRELIELAPPDPAVAYTATVPEDQFDLVWCFAVLGGLSGDGLSEAAAQMARAVRPGGLLFLAENTAPQPETVGIWQFWPPRSYIDLFAEHGIRLRPIGTHDSAGAEVTMFAGEQTVGLIESTISIEGVDRPFFCRSGTSDMRMLQQVLQDKAIDLPSLRRWPEIQRCSERHPNTLIIDAGANVGAASLWFSGLFPSAFIVAVEPEPSNCAVLKLNVDGLNVEIIESALAGECGAAAVYHPRGEPQDGWGHAGFCTRPAPDGVPAYAMDDLLRRYGGGRIPFIAKLDIEGGEADVFRNPAWIERFPVVIVELHDGLFPGRRLAASFLAAVAALDRDFITHGEHVFSISNRIGSWP